MLAEEQELLRRELEIVRGSPATRSAASESSAAVTSGGVRSIRELLPEFDGADNTFWRWKQQLQLLRRTYNLDENATQILVSSRLKGRALSWFYSKAEYLVLSIESLLEKMEQMCDLRLGKLTMRREFESQIWKSGESFCDYYHDKMILANRVPIADDEILDYIIEGVSDQQLQNQARILNCKAGIDLLKAFKKIQLDGGRINDTKEKKDGLRTTSGRKTEVPAAGDTKRCHRCRETGHVAAQCKRALTRRACFVCGATEHFARECPRRNQASTSETPKDGTRVATTNMVHPVNLPKPYMIRVKILPLNAEDKCVYIMDAMIDSGSLPTLAWCAAT